MPPSKAPFFTVIQWPGMNDVSSPIFVQHKDHLQEPAPLASTPNEPFVILYFSWERTSGSVDRHFGFLWKNSVAGDMLDVPFIPTEVHKYLCKKIAKWSMECQA
jgi:hypothetical protein